MAIPNEVDTTEGLETCVNWIGVADFREINECLVRQPAPVLRALGQARNNGVGECRVAVLRAVLAPPITPRRQLHQLVDDHRTENLRCKETTHVAEAERVVETSVDEQALRRTVQTTVNRRDGLILDGGNVKLEYYLYATSQVVFRSLVAFGWRHHGFDTLRVFVDSRVSKSGRLQLLPAHHSGLPDLNALGDGSRPKLVLGQLEEHTGRRVLLGLEFRTLDVVQSVVDLSDTSPSLLRSRL